MDIDLKSAFKSHQDKFLQDHLMAVAKGVRKRTEILNTTLKLKIGEIAAIFHDLGKINPNFQKKLEPGYKKKDKGEKEYSDHAYLSAFAWLRYFQANSSLVKDLIGGEYRVISVAAMIARHHGDLPNFENGIFNKRPADALNEFLKTHSNLPISEFLQLIFEHKSFELLCSQLQRQTLLERSLSPEKIKEPLAFYLETLFSFSCLLEADKRDAGNNYTFNREILRPYFKDSFRQKINRKLETFISNSSLDQLRTDIREEAINNLRVGLDRGNRLFTLSAPTGAGKTMMLLSLASEIFGRDPDLSIIYALPFLSITEQVEEICKSIFQDNERAVLRIDSKSENKVIEEIQEKLDNDPMELKKLLKENFSEHTFDHPFIITTFVQIFEALVSNRNSTLLRLPNFSRTIFLLDEIQALPPHLYTFFVALLDEFCRQFDSYVIISTATMPYLEIPDKAYLPDDEKPKKLFKSYKTPEELLPYRKYYKAPEFNRYTITKIKHDYFQIPDLAQIIEKEKSSSLTILNTIDDTKMLFERFKQENDSNGSKVVLLNTHFTLNDRRKKIAFCKQKLNRQERVILISTQLIEAGVDIDFPSLFRDLCTLPSLIQSAGRCNRNGKLECGRVYFFELKKDNGKLSASLIYRDEAFKFVTFCRDRIIDSISEKEIFSLQQEFFRFVSDKLEFGCYKHSSKTLNMVKAINRAAFEDLGKFKLIDPEYYGKERRYYIPVSEDDREFEKLKDLESTFSKGGFEEVKKRQIKIEQQLIKMSGQIVNIRLPENKIGFAPFSSEEAMAIHKLASLEDYSEETGLKLNIAEAVII
jgi:CRISPR-associated endonuclease/helicase Cas3